MGVVVSLNKFLPSLKFSFCKSEVLISVVFAVGGNKVGTVQSRDLCSKWNSL